MESQSIDSCNKSILIKRFRQGHRDSFQQVFDTFYESLCLFTNRFIKDLPTSEDIVQETFLALWNSREEMASGAHIKSFLYQVARNNALNHLKHERIKNNYCAQAISELEETESFINFVIEEEVDRLLLKTEIQLAPKCGEIFMLSMQGKENEEIAELLHISVNTVKTQKKIAYKKLKQYIAEIGMVILSIHSFPR